MDEVAEHLRDEAAADGVDLDKMVEEKNLDIIIFILPKITSSFPFHLDRVDSYQCYTLITSHYSLDHVPKNNLLHFDSFLYTFLH